MKTVRMIYRQESDGAWIGTSPEIPGYTAHGDTYDEARDRANDGLAWFAEQDLCIAHIASTVAPGQPTAGRRVSLALTASPERAGYRHRFKEVTGRPQ
jgi:predicted RNase H-like HicB family nuclease